MKNATAWTNGQQKEVSGKYVVINYISKMQHHQIEKFFSRSAKQEFTAKLIILSHGLISAKMKVKKLKVL